jgi:RNA 2',3'-cyclic 3'-phosphodiesterase
MLRTFLALTLDAIARGCMVQFQSELQSILRPVAPSLRPTRPEQLHITLAFLGDTPDEQVPHIKAIVDQVAQRHPLFELTSGPCRGLPKPRRTQVVALDLCDANRCCEQLAADIVTCLATLGFVFERRPFLPHLTLFRSRKPFRLPAADALDAESQLPRTVLRLTEVAHYASFLEASGARYELLSASPLGISIP